MTAGAAYAVVVDGYNGKFGQYQIDITAQQVYTHCCPWHSCSCCTLCCSFAAFVWCCKLCTCLAWLHYLVKAVTDGVRGSGEVLPVGCRTLLPIGSAALLPIGCTALSPLAVRCCLSAVEHTAAYLTT